MEFCVFDFYLFFLQRRYKEWYNCLSLGAFTHFIILPIRVICPYFSSNCQTQNADIFSKLRYLKRKISISTGWFFYYFTANQSEAAYFFYHPGLEQKWNQAELTLLRMRDNATFELKMCSKRALRSLCCKETVPVESQPWWSPLTVRVLHCQANTTAVLMSGRRSKGAWEGYVSPTESIRRNKGAIPYMLITSCAVQLHQYNQNYKKRN